MNLDELKPSDPAVMLDGVNKRLAMKLKRQLDVSTIEDLFYTNTRELLSVPGIAENKEFKIANQASVVVGNANLLDEVEGFGKTMTIGSDR